MVMRLSFLTISISIILMAASSGIAGKDRLHLEFSDSAALHRQSNGLPDGILLNDVHSSSEFSGVADFGKSGLIQFPEFAHPTGPFTIEARFILRNYGPESSRFVADILNTATWDNGPSQGFAFRVGGSYLYPVLDKKAYASEEEWNASMTAFTHIERGNFSQCFAAFAMARSDSDRSWKTVVTDRCIELNVWTHMVAVWDGENMRIYLNGIDATDMWRILGQGVAPNLDSIVVAYVGARTTESFDSRHFDGVLDFVRVRDGALTEAEIRGLYKKTFAPEIHETLCKGVIQPMFPEPGQVVKGDSPFRFKIIAHGGCVNPAFLPTLQAGDSIVVEFAKDATFANPILSFIVTDTCFQLQADDLQKIGPYLGAIFWRARLFKAEPNGLGKVSAGVRESDWSLARPIVMNLNQSTALTPYPGLRPAIRIARPGRFFPDNGRGEMPEFFHLNGRRIQMPLLRVEGGWILSPDTKSSDRMFLFRIPADSANP